MPCEHVRRNYEHVIRSMYVVSNTVPTYGSSNPSECTYSTTLKLVHSGKVHKKVLLI
jgi:hypothetical protein